MSLIRVWAAPDRKVPIAGRGLAPTTGAGLEVERTREVDIHLASGDLVLAAPGAAPAAPTPDARTKKETAQ